jgi:hypothetical protein
VLVDPDDPAAVSTTHDVATNHNAGFGVLSAFGVVLAALGIAGAGWYLWFRRRSGARMRRSHAEVATRLEAGS